MTQTAAQPTAVQVMAAKVRLKADRRLKRESPAAIKEIAQAQPAPARPRLLT